MRPPRRSRTRKRRLPPTRRTWTRPSPCGPARRAWPRAPRRPRPHAEPFPGKDEKARDTARLNFIGIVFCMMFGTAALPHILMRYYTTPSVQQARVSVFWSLFFIFLLYFTAPCLAVLAKYDMYTNLVGSSFASLPAMGGGLGQGGPCAAEHHRHQQGRHRAAGRES